jgi:carbon monoxide dehydrogenase subunit G
MAEQLVNEFTVNRPIDEAWPVICDLERIAPCLPGAQLQEIEGDEYRGIVKVKLGAVATQFKGAASFTSRDDSNYTAALHAEGRDTGGRGNAAAEITARAEALSATSTRIEVIADLHITGKVAQFGRGILGDVSKKLMTQFATNLNAMLDESGPSQVVAAPESAPEEPASDQIEPPKVRKIDGPASEPIDMAGMAGPALAKRFGPALVVLLLALLLLRRRSN